MPIDLAAQSADRRRAEVDLLARTHEGDLATPGRIVVVAPHPDDEVLGLGGFLSRCAHVAARVEIVAVSDGEGAYVEANREQRQQLVWTRAAERKLALEALGLAVSRIHRLGIADGAVAQTNEAMLDHLVRILAAGNAPSDARPTVLVAPWRHDLHPDHEAAGRVSSRAAIEAGCEFWEVPIWSWYHLGDLPTPLPLDRATRVALTPEERHAKRAALNCFQSQTEPPAPHRPVLPIDFLEAFDRDFEIVLR